MTGVKACHSEHSAFGVILEYKGKKYYVTGDTLYNTDILKSLPENIYAVFLPVNGVGNNMNGVSPHLGCLGSKSVLWCTF